MKQGGHRICSKCGFLATGSEEICPSDGSKLNSMGRDPYLGTTVAGKYEVVELLGRGGMSVVYKVKHIFMGRFEALKMLRVELVADGEALQRFQQESQVVSTLRHQNIITVLDFGLLDDDTPFLSMDYIEGNEFSDLLKREGSLSVEQAIPIFAQLCDGLYHAHQRGVIHRDIKPSNIVMTKNETHPIIVDFGIAKLLAADGSTLNKLTTTGQVFGSPLYMSPEQCSSRRADERTDIYALGCVLYQTLTGVPPIQGNSPVETMMRQMQERPRSFAMSAPHQNIPQALEYCVFKALQKEPQDRFNNMNEFRNALLKAANFDTTAFVTDLKVSNPDQSFPPGNEVLRSHVTAGNTDSNLKHEQFRQAIAAIPDAAPAPSGKPVIWILAAVALMILCGAMAVVFLSPKPATVDDDTIDVQSASSDDAGNTQKKPGYADPNVANLNNGKPIQIAMGKQEMAAMPVAQDVRAAESDSLQAPARSRADVPLAAAPLPSSPAPGNASAPDEDKVAGRIEYNRIAALPPAQPTKAKASFASRPIPTEAAKPNAMSSQAPMDTASSDTIASAPDPSSAVSAEPDLSPGRIGNWRVSRDQVNALYAEPPGSVTGYGAIFEIGFNPLYGKDLNKLAGKQATTLTQALSSSEASIEDIRTSRRSIGSNRSIPVVFQTITYNAPDPQNPQDMRKSYVIYYLNDNYLYALHVVPGTCGNRAAENFINNKLLPGFKPL